MSTLNQEQPIKEEVSNGGKAFSYTELVYREFNSKIKPIEHEIKELEASINEVLDDIAQERANGNSNNKELIDIIAKLREKLAAKQKEQTEARHKYEPDLNLKMMAIELDGIDKGNKMLDLYNILGHKVNEIISILSEIEAIAGGNYYAPASCSMLKQAVTTYMVPNINIEFTKLHRRDEKYKQDLEQRLMAKMEELDKTKNTPVKEKYRGMLNG